MKPKVTVVIAVYNGSSYVLQAIRSILNQSYKQFEIIIVNDNSTDNTKKIIKNIKSSKIKLINLNKNLGPYKCLDIGFKKARGKYIAILDSDDLAHRNRLSAQTKILDNETGTALVASWYTKIDQKNKIIEKVKMPPSDKGLFDISFPCNNLICNSSVMFRKRILKKIKYFDNNFFYSNDYNFFLRVFVKYKIKVIKKFYVFYRVHDNQMSQSKKLIKIICKENLKNLEWSKNHNLINRNNIFFYYKAYVKNYFKLLLNYSL
jgi:glycosyltransferase involved in cell wall biosynthesis